MTRTIAAGLTGLVLAVIVAASVLMGYRWAEGTYQKRIAEQERAAAKYAAEQRERHDELTRAFEALRTARAQAVKEIRHEVERVVERPVYSSCTLDADGLRLANAALGLSSTAPGAGGVVPGARAADGRDDGLAATDAH